MFTILVITTILLVLFALIISDFIKGGKLPVGPTPLPFIGNILQLPKERLWVKLFDWSKEYGGLYSVWIGRTPVLVISDPAIASELLDKRSGNYSSRPRLVVFGEIFTKMSAIIVIPYGKAWSLQRKLFNHVLKPSNFPLYQPRQVAEATKLTMHILQDPEKWTSSTDRFFSSITFTITYGRRVDTLDSEVVKSKRDFSFYQGSLVDPGAYLAEIFPFLAKLPHFLAPWKRPVEIKGNQEMDFNIALVDVVRSDLKKRGEKTGKVSLTEMVLDLKDKQKLDISERELANIPGIMFAAGADTSGISLQWAILGIATHPEVLHAAQTEIDEVVGNNRSPDFSDKLPYIDALVQEVLRWRPVAPMALPHATSEADIYKGFHIPKATTIMTHVWAMNMNEEYFPRPDILAPSRYLAPSDPRFDPSLKGKDFPSRYGQAGFGWGRRACPGAELAITSIRISLSKLIWAFDISSLDKQHYGTTNNISETRGTLEAPSPFVCQFRIRSDRHREVLERDLCDANRVLDDFPPFE